MSNTEVTRALGQWFLLPGAYVMIDGQYGSTGKGLLAGALAECFHQRVGAVVSNAGPNSGHTSIFEGETIILKQLPTFSVIARRLSESGGPNTILSAGAIINPKILAKETSEHDIRPYIHPHAAIIDEASFTQDAETVRDIASTGQGVGPALERKLRRNPNVRAVWDPTTDAIGWSSRLIRDQVCFFEVSQGYSLGINAGFYPHTTSRECTVSQALSDASMPPTFFRKAIMTVRAHPIRVGNTENSSGPGYPDQAETSWSALGVAPETTTVTKRERRVFTWSDQQFRDAVSANTPSVIFLNFVQYLSRDGIDVDRFVTEHVISQYEAVMRHPPERVLLGFGPKSSDIRVWA